MGIFVTEFEPVNGFFAQRSVQTPIQQRLNRYSGEKVRYGL